MVGVEFPVLDGLQRLGQERRHLLGGEDDAILAVAREDAADEERLESQYRQLATGAITQTFEALCPGGDREGLRGARLIGKAYWAQHHIDVLAGHAISPGMIRPVGAAVVQALQLVLELRQGQLQACVQLERRGVHLRRQRPAAPLELRHHEAIEVPRIQECGENRPAEDEEQRALQRRSSSPGARRL